MKTRIANYTFSAAAKQVTFTDYALISLDAILLIVNVTDNIIIYNFADATKGGTVATNVLTLDYDTTGMADGDKLLIYYDDPSNLTDEITYLVVNKTGTDGDIIAAPAAGYHLRIHHIYVNNADTTDSEFYIRNGSGGSPYFAFYLASYGGGIAQNLKRPWDLTTATALYYDHILGTTPDLWIVIGYETVAD